MAYEYKVLTSGPELEAEMNALTREGWRFVATLGVDVLLERSIPQDA